MRLRTLALLTSLMITCGVLRAAADQATPKSGWIFPPGVTNVIIPARFSTHGEIVVRMTVRGRGLDLLLDTGMSGSQLDSSIVTWLGLGQGPEVTLHTVSFGATQMRELPFAEGSFYRRGEDGSLIVGLLGYDFLKQAVVEIDYDHQEVHIIQPTAFTAPSRSMKYPLYADDTVPLVSADVGGAVGGSFVVDTGATSVVVFPRLVLNNPRSFALAQELNDNSQAVYFKFFWPMCGHVEMIPYSVNEMRVESVGVKDWVVWSAPQDSCFSTRMLDGLIGFDFLRLFNVYIDYPQNLVILEPNTAYMSAPNTIKL
jgi:hypothetical protein